MAKEMEKAVVAEAEVGVIEETAAEVETVESDDIEVDFKIERKAFKLENGKTAFDYFIKANFYGVKEMDIHFVPADVAGYDLYDLIFTLSKDAPLIRLRKWEIKGDRKKGEKDSSGYSVYMCATVDPKNIRTKLRAQRTSDKEKFAMLLAMNGLGND